MITEEDLLETLVSEIAYVLGDDLVAIYLYGAYADGDFTADRSNVNLLVITRSDPDEQTRARLQQAHDSSTALFPDWADHLAAEYVSQPALTRFRDAPHLALRCEVREHPEVRWQVYGTLVMCRAWYSARRHTQCAKREAALFTAAEFPAWAGLIHWAELWWFGGGSDAEPGRNDEASRFVDELSARLPTDSNQLEFA